MSDQQTDAMMNELAEHMIMSTDESSIMDIVKDSLKSDWLAHPENFQQEWAEYESNGGVKI
tara:strand:- start:342 stop:524 length:183 start_codon:yes stop_codon:yes gene_type:complete